MRRREFIAGLGSAAALPAMARAQQATMPIVGWLGTGILERTMGPIAALQQGLRDTGFVLGRNVAFEYKFAEYRLDCYRLLHPNWSAGG
jgi:putative ABC transport system substrate-binding protein